MESGYDPSPSNGAFSRQFFCHTRRAADNVTSIYLTLWIKEHYFFPTSKKKVDYFDKPDSLSHIGKHKARVSATDNDIESHIVVLGGQEEMGKNRNSHMLAC